MRIRGLIEHATKQIPISGCGHTDRSARPHVVHKYQVVRGRTDSLLAQYGEPIHSIAHVEIAAHDNEHTVPLALRRCKRSQLQLSKLRATRRPSQHYLRFATELVNGANRFQSMLANL